MVLTYEMLVLLRRRGRRRGARHVGHRGALRGRRRRLVLRRRRRDLDRVALRERRRALGRGRNPARILVVDQDGLSADACVRPMGDGRLCFLLLLILILIIILNIR